MTEFFINYTAQTTLLEAIGASDTTLQIVPVAASPTLPQFRIRIDDEILLVTGVAGQTYTVTRGIEGTTAAAHDRVIVHYVLTAAALGGQSDPAPTVPGLRSLGTGANQAAAGNDPRFTAASTPTAHASSHHSGGSDPLAGQSIAGLLTTSTPGFSGLRVTSIGRIGWSPGADPTVTADAFFIRTAAGQISQRDGMNNQFFRVYGPHDGTNGCDVCIIGNSGGMGPTIMAEGAGTGAPANLTFRTPSGGNVVLYLNHLQPWTTNTQDIGLTNNRFRSGYFGTSLALSASANLNWNGDTFLVRDAANTLAMRNGASGQQLYLYNTYTDATHYERMFLGWESGYCFIRADQANGTNRLLAIDFSTIYLKTLNVNRWIIAQGGTFLPGGDNLYPIGTPTERVQSGYFGTSIVNSGYEEFAEMGTAPVASANTARLFAKDNGSGKTQLCVQFPTGGVQVISTEP